MAPKYLLDTSQIPSKYFPNTSQNYTTLYKTIHNWIELYTTVQNCTTHVFSFNIFNLLACLKASLVNHLTSPNIKILSMKTRKVVLQKLCNDERQAPTKSSNFYTP